MTKNYIYLDNAYWELDDRSAVKCIRMTTLPDGKRQKDVLMFNKLRQDGTIDPHYKEVVDQWGIEHIDKNTAERKEKKERERREKQAVQDQQRKTRELEILFNTKLQAFELDEIKNCDDRELRSKMRKAKNIFELNALGALIYAKELGYIVKVESNE